VLPRKGRKNLKNSLKGKKSPSLASRACSDPTAAKKKKVDSLGTRDRPKKGTMNGCSEDDATEKKKRGGEGNTEALNVKGPRNNPKVKEDQNA